MIQRVSGERQLNILNDALNANNVKKEIQEDKSSKVATKLQPCKKLDDKNMVFRGKKVMSAKSGVISDMGGPNKHLGSETSNSIWNTNTLKELKESQDNKQKTHLAKEALKNKRDETKEKQLNQMVNALDSTDTRKDSTVLNKASFKGSNYQISQNNISIFDTEEFERVPKKTHGEKVAEEARTIKEKDGLWEKVAKPKTINDAINNLFKG